jgi:hypothetical protein
MSPTATDGVKPASQSVKEKRQAAERAKAKRAKEKRDAARMDKAPA